MENLEPNIPNVSDIPNDAEVPNGGFDVNDISPDFLKEGENVDSHIDNIFTPLEQNSSEGLSDYQIELLEEEYGWSHEEISSFSSWEAVEEHIALDEGTSYNKTNSEFDKEVKASSDVKGAKETKDNEQDKLDDVSENNEKSIEEKQEIADQAAKDYNAKTNPYERAVEKGVEGVKKTENGGVSFEDTDAIYEKDDGTKCVVKIEATGNRSRDFDAANKAMGLDETPEGYVWHHRDDYNVKDGTITLELVKDEAHNASKPHSGGCAQYDAVNGPTYNPPRKGDNANV